MSARATLVLDSGVVECAAVLGGTVSWSGNRKHDQVLLRCRTQGRGDVDALVVARCDLGTDQAGEARFLLRVPPNGPVTYHGQLLRLLWQASVQIPVPRGFSLTSKEATSAEVTVVPRGWLATNAAPDDRR